MPQLDFSTFPSQIFWLLVIFAGLYIVMAYMALPRLAQIIEDREDRINNDLNKARELQKEAEFVEVEYRKIEAEAKAKAKAIIDDIKHQIEHDIKASQEKLIKELEEDISKADARIRAAYAESMANIESVVRTLTAQTFSQITGEKIDKVILEEKLKEAINEVNKTSTEKMNHAA
jgi:F-type H+-transporting ATPase subunit b